MNRADAIEVLKSGFRRTSVVDWLETTGRLTSQQATKGATKRSAHDVELYEDSVGTLFANRQIKRTPRRKPSSSFLYHRER
jgi:hypothetical protein